MLVIMQRTDGTGVTFDAVPRETHTSTTTPTKFPVESGGGRLSSISDNMTIEGDQLVLEAVVGAEPLSPGVGMPSAPDRVKRAYDALVAMQREGALLKVVTSLRTYEDMVIKLLSIPRDAATSLSLSGQITLEQIQTVTSQTLSIPPTRKPSSKRSTADGRLTGEEVPKPKVSWARQAAQGLARLAGGDAAEAALQRVAKGGG
jgi:hypothetical protein